MVPSLAWFQVDHSRAEDSQICVSTPNLSPGLTANCMLQLKAPARLQCVQVNVSKAEHITCHSKLLVPKCHGSQTPERQLFSPLLLFHHTSCSSIVPISLNLPTPDHSTANTLAPSAVIFHDNYCNNFPVVFWFSSCLSSTTPLAVIFLKFKCYYKIVLLKTFKRSSLTQSKILTPYHGS